jgi:hypothetical protein
MWAPQLQPGALLPTSTRPGVLMRVKLGDRRKREAPCAAQPAGASAPHRAFQAGTIHLCSIARCYPSFRTECHRPSELALWRAIRFSAPPAPVARFGCADVVGSSSPVARSVLSNPPTSSLRLPGALPSTSPARPFPGCPVLTLRAANDPPPIPLPPREPGWTLEQGHFPKGSTTCSRPFLGLRLACACRCVAYCAPRVFPGQEVIFNSQGYPPSGRDIPRSFPVVHCPCTGLCTSCRQVQAVWGRGWLTIRWAAGTIIAMTLRHSSRHLACIIIIR